MVGVLVVLEDEAGETLAGLIDLGRVIVIKVNMMFNLINLIM